MTATPDMSNATFDGDRPAGEAPELVPWDSRCPRCDEQRMDWLAWDGDNIPAPAFYAPRWVEIPDEKVTCQTCDHRYRPPGY